MTYEMHSRASSNRRRTHQINNRRANDQAILENPLGKPLMALKLHSSCSS